MVTSKHNEKVPPVGDDERRHQLQRIYDKISALVYVVIHAVVGAFMPKNCLSRASSLDTQGEKKIRLRSFRRIPRALWGRGHEVIPLRSHMPSLLLQKHHQENNRSELVLLKKKNSWWWVALLKKKKEPSSWWWLVLRKELKISRWWLMLIKKKKEYVKSSRWNLVLMFKLKSKCLTSATCKLGTRSWSVWHWKTTAWVARQSLDSFNDLFCT